MLKPLHSPYFALSSAHRGPDFYIKLKKDYLQDMGGERDLGDFAIVGAGYHAATAAKSEIQRLRWTHFHVCCLTNKAAAPEGAEAVYKVVAVIRSDRSCIPKAELRYLDDVGRLHCSPDHVFTCMPSRAHVERMTDVFDEPFVAELLGSGYQKTPNEALFMLRHPRAASWLRLSSIPTSLILATSPTARLPWRPLSAPGRGRALLRSAAPAPALPLLVACLRSRLPQRIMMPEAF